MGVISFFLNLFKKSRKVETSEHESSQIMEELLADLRNRSENRQVYNELTEQIINTISDDDLLDVIFNNLIQKLSIDYKKEYEIALSWNKSRQAIYMIWALEMEVFNGGFNQFYFNPSGKFYKLIPDLLILVGANKFSELTSRANKTFEKENSKITQHQDGTLEGFSKSYDDNPLEKFDDEYYELNEVENLQDILVEYIKKNKIEFVDQ